VSVAPTCLRCGDFVAGGTPLPGIPLCNECFGGKSVIRRGVAAVLPPRGVIGRRYWAMVPVTALGFGLGAWAGFVDAVGQHYRLILILIAGSMGGILGLTVSGVTLFSTRRHLGLAEWKAKVLAQLGFRHDDAALSLVVKTSSIAFFPEPGLLTRGEGGLVFMGVRGTRLVFGFDEIADARVQMVFPPTTSPCSTLRIEGAGGSRHRFAFLVEGTYARNKALAAEAAAWINGRGRRSPS
jgi:hypothetical protein